MILCVNTGRVIPPFATVCPHCGLVSCIRNASTVALEKKRQDTQKLASLTRVRISSGFSNFDRLVDGGFHTGDVCIITARPGAGKTTFTLQIAANIANIGIRVLFFSGEMDEFQILKYIDRYGINGDGIDFVYLATIDDLLIKMRSGNYQYVVLDSLQALKNGESSRLSLRTQITNTTALINTAKRYGVAVLAISQVNKDGRIAGPNEVAHAVDAIFMMECGLNGEVVVSSREKNRLNGDSDVRAIFRKTPKGLLPIEEIETGQIMRHEIPEGKGVVAFPFFKAGEATTEELTIISGGQMKGNLQVVGKSPSSTAFLSGVLRRIVPEIDLDCIVQGNDNKRMDQSADLAICIGVIAIFLAMTLPVGMAFMGAIDANGEILHVEGLEKRAKRAIAQGYTKVYGPRPIGKEHLVWTACSSLQALITELGWIF